MSTLMRWSLSRASDRDRRIFPHASALGDFSANSFEHWSILSVAVAVGDPAGMVADSDVSFSPSWPPSTIILYIHTTKTFIYLHFFNFPILHQFKNDIHRVIDHVSYC